MTDVFGAAFSEDDLRAMGNALDRAEIEVHEGGAFDDGDADAERNNQRDVETAQRMWALLGPLLVGRLPALDRAGVLADLATVTLDGEEDAEGEPYDVSNDETFDTLSALVRRARAGLANGRFGDRP